MQYSAYEWIITVRVRRIELRSNAWEAFILPLNYTRALSMYQKIHPQRVPLPKREKSMYPLLHRR